jgi:membrane fusion protein (multidrug efflux system)
VQRREVRIGARRPGSVEVLAGLNAGERVVVEGTQKIRDGATVRGTERDAEVLQTDNVSKSHEASSSPASIAQ